MYHIGMRILNAAQMREADRFTIEEIGIPSLVLMENAGRQVVAAIEAAYEARLNGRVAVLCGRGNNGGDGFVVARTLMQRGVGVSTPDHVKRTRIGRPSSVSSPSKIPTPSLNEPITGGSRSPGRRVSAQ